MRENRPQGTLLHNLLLFNRVLHGLGLEVNPARMIELQAAFAHVPIGHQRDFYHTLRSFLVKRKEDLPLFDEAFDLFWRKPPDDVQELSLDQFLGFQDEDSQPPQEQLVVLPQPALREDTGPEPETEGDELEIVELTQTYSTREILRNKDFSELTAKEFAAIKGLMAELVWQLGRRKTRRYIPGQDGMLDIRRSLRRNLRHGGELLAWSYRTPKIKPRPLVLIADISGSMEHYTRPLLHFMYSLRHGLQQKVELFVFSTRLTCITRQLRHKNVDQALNEVSSVVHDWSGGTRIGDVIKTFNYDWARRVLRGGPVVLLISDGWDRGDPALLYKEMARLHRLCHRLIWLNPLLGAEQYEPLTRGIRAALPHIDDFLPVHNLASLEDLAHHLQKLGERRSVQSAFVPVAGRSVYWRKEGTMKEVMGDIRRWRSQGKAVALATVVQTWGSAPRKAGAKMAITTSGQISGSVSGGCVESAVAEEAMAILQSGFPKLLSYGVADETGWAVGLACGGNIGIFVEVLDSQVFSAAEKLLADERSGATATVIAGPHALLGRKLLIDAKEERTGGIDATVDDTVAALMKAALQSGSARRVALEARELDLFVDVLLPPPDLIMVGGVHIAVALAALAKTLGYRTVVIDPRHAFGSAERFTHVDRLIQAWPQDAFSQLTLHENTAVALLTHDPKIDDPALEIALRSAAFYVGALGSRKTHAGRVKRLQEAGFSNDEISTIHAPIGLDIHARDPEEIALSIMAEIVKARRS